MTYKQALAGVVVVLAGISCAIASAGAPLMGEGRLAVVNAEPERADLVATDNAVFDGGILYIDHHVRMKDLAGDPPQVEMLFREVVDCRKQTMFHTTLRALNYHTGKQAGDMPATPESESRPVSQDFFHAKLCQRLFDGQHLDAAITHDHAEALKHFPRFALSIKDALKPSKIEDGVIVEAEETALLQHLRRVNPAF